MRRDRLIPIAFALRHFEPLFGRHLESLSNRGTIDARKGKFDHWIGEKERAFRRIVVGRAYR
jgi:hypothetical protein